MNNADKSAAPLHFLSADEQLKIEQFGLTKREYFAGLAMQGLLAGESENECYGSYDDWARASISYADALLKHLNKGGDCE